MRSRMKMALCVSFVAGCGVWAAERPLPAFPGAEGWGCETPGGRGGKVMIVTNLNPDGPGSLQEACAATGPRIVVFEISGVISNTITIEHSNITIAGQTAPGAGITIAGMLGSKEGIRDVVIRHIRVRPPRAADTFAGPEGEKVARRVHECGLANPYLKEEQKVFSIEPFRTEPNESHHAAFLNGVSNLVLDHCSFAWGADEVVSLCRTPDVTVQWCSIEEGAIKEGKKYSGIHNFALFSAYLDKARISVHHNLIAHNSRRNPTIPDGPADVRNNVLYNYRHGFTHEGSQRREFNYVGNWFKTGANSRGVLEGVSWGRAPATWAWFDAAARYYLEDNLVDGQPAPIPETVGKAKTPFPRLREPVAAPPVTTQSAVETYDLVLARAGAFPRDAVTRRTIEETRIGTGQWGRREPEGGLMAGLTPSAPLKDGDRDGMSDEWETKNGLDPAKDDSGKPMPDGYTAIEVYMAERAERLLPPGGMTGPSPTITRALALHRSGENAAALRQFDEALADADPFLRREALAGLASMGAQAAPVFDRVIQALAREEDAQARAAAARALASMAGQTSDRLVALVTSQAHPRCRAGALSALAILGPPSLAALSTTIGALEDGALRLQALRTLAAWKGASAPAAARLAAMVGDKDGEMADAACEALVAIGPAAEPAMPALIEVFRRSEPEYQARAVVALTALGAIAAPAVEALMDDADQVLVSRAINLLTALGPAAQAAAPALRRRLLGKHWAAVAEALLAIGPGQEQAVFDALVPRLSEPNAVAEASAIMIRMAGGKADSKRRQSVVNALAKEISAQAEKEVTPSRLACIRALLRSLGALGTAAAPAVPILKQVSRNAQMFHDVREVWPKIMPGEALPAPQPDLDDL